MLNPSPQFTRLISRALSGGTEITLNELIDALELRDQGLLLDQIESIRTALNTWQLQLTPHLNTGDLDTSRVLRALDIHPITTEMILAEINKGECATVEFKSSLLYDHKKAVFAPQTPLKELRSDEVILSTLKTIGAFLTCGGGTLFVGLDDNSNILGLDYDCSILDCNTFDADKWQLELRNQITGKFKDGKSINDYLEVTFALLGQISVARIQIQGRRKLAFIKKGNNISLLRRQGNRTVEVFIDELEEFIEHRKGNGWC